MPISLYRSDDGCESFRVVHEFPSGEVRHIHHVTWDPFDGSLLMGTGDANPECRLARSLDGGLTWQTLGGGSQHWRSVSVSLRPEALYWGTDAGSDTGLHRNHVMRFARATSRLEKVSEIQGPCHGNATLADGTLLVSTGVEGGRNEQDRKAHVWASRDGRAWCEVRSFRKDPMPMLLHFGVVRFPASAGGFDGSGVFAFTAFGLVGGAETSFLARLRD
jgi:hypothetical protein